MIDLVDLRLRRLPQVSVTDAPAARLSGPWVRRVLRSCLGVLRGALGIIWVVLPALLWVVAVGLLVQAWVSWWVELESSARSAGFLLTWDVSGPPR